MKVFSCILILHMLSICVHAQKSIIDKSTCDNWVSLEEIEGKSCIISNNGKYVVYQTKRGNREFTLTLRDITLGWEKKFLNALNPAITGDSRYFIIQLPNDELVITDLTRMDECHIHGVQNYSIAEQGSSEFIAYKMVGDDQRLVIRKMGGDTHQVISPVLRYWFDKSGMVLLTTSISGITLHDINKNSHVLVHHSVNATDLTFSPDNKHIAFIHRDTSGSHVKLYDIATQHCVTVATHNTPGIEGYAIAENAGLRFSADGRRIFFKTAKSGRPLQSPNNYPPITSDINIWSYKDKVLQEKQLADRLDINRHYTFIAGIGSNKVIQLETDVLQLDPDSEGNNFALVSTKINPNEFYWNKDRQALYLISLADGSKKLVYESGYPGFFYPKISPRENFVIWFNGSLKQYFSYSIKEDAIRNISESVPEPLSVKNQRGEAAKIINKYYPFGKSFWSATTESVLVYDENDIWELDLFAKRRPVNVTNGYGKRNNIRFRFLEYSDFGEVGPFDRSLLWAFNEENKQNGFWRTAERARLDPVKLVMENYAFYFEPRSPITSTSSVEDPSRFMPIKAKSAKAFVVRRMSGSEPANLFLTSDFRNFSPLTDLDPEKNYNWISRVLIKWRLPDGEECDGILHRPENFDSTKKHPLIFNYYERRSELLNVYRIPELSGDNINIPWYTSRGYMVFEPDFYYKRGKTAQSVIDIISSAVQRLHTLSYIDIKHMGLQGQSHGGYETNVLATGTNLFAAACEMAGYSNIISEYGSIRPGGLNNQSGPDLDQRNLGVYPWEHPEVFIENSPIFHVGKMTTPLLMIHNRRDGAVLFSHAVELYLAMRRMGRKVWFLEYDGEGHSIHNENNKLDFTIRMQQFFDYYLKGAAPPVWMTSGIPASDKGILSGLALDTSGCLP